MEVGGVSQVSTLVPSRPVTSESQAAQPAQDQAQDGDPTRVIPVQGAETSDGGDTGAELGSRVDVTA